MPQSGDSAHAKDEVNCEDDYERSVKPISTKDLVTWASQVSGGMEHLVSKKIFHGDLAARNILLADGNIVKISDFGLSKSLYKGDYKKKGDAPLPLKWMSIESIRDKTFSMESDVWSFGILLWEFFSLAETPYPGMEADERLFKKLTKGFRMDSPSYATEEIYSIMLNCWHVNPSDRPSFPKIRGMFQSMLGKISEEVMLGGSTEEHYIDLSLPYIQTDGTNNEGMVTHL